MAIRKETYRYVYIYILSVLFSAKTRLIGTHFFTSDCFLQMGQRETIFVSSPLTEEKKWIILCLLHATTS